MLDTNDRVVICRCFDAAPPALHISWRELADAGHRPDHAGRSRDAVSFLRPDVPCLQHWMDLNA